MRLSELHTGESLHCKSERRGAFLKRLLEMGYAWAEVKSILNASQRPHKI